MGQPRSRSIRPDPDPTVITTEIIDKGLVQIRREMSHMQELFDAKIGSIDARHQVREEARIEQKADTKEALAAALAAQKEAVREQTIASEKAINKSEEATKEQLTQLSATFTATFTAIDVTISDLKERVSRIENVKVGGNEAKAGLYGLAGFIVALIVIGGFAAAIWPG